MSHAESPVIQDAIRNLAEIDRNSPPIYKTTQKALDAVGVLTRYGLYSPDQTEFLLSVQWLDAAVTKAKFEKPRVFSIKAQKENINDVMTTICAGSIKTLTGYIKSEDNSQKNKERQEASIRLLNNLYIYGDANIRKQVLTEYLRFQPQIIKHMLSGKVGFDNAETIYLEEFPFNGHDFIHQTVSIAKSIPDSEYKPFIRELFLEEETFGTAKELAQNLLPRYGFAEDEIDELVNTIDNVPVYVADNMDAIFSLEKKIKGITRWLMYAQGIKHFGRYPEELILEQNKYRDDKKSPWGIIIYPESDYNGGFQENFSVFRRFKSKLTEAAKSGHSLYRLRIVEGGSLLSISKNLIRMVNDYGPVTFGIIGGHGIDGKIRFGYGEAGHVLSKRDLDSGQGIKRFINKVFLPDSQIILNSCSTGNEIGIAGSLSKMGVEVFAPSEVDNYLAINISFDRGKLKIDPDYSKPKSKNRFVNGKLVAKGK